MIDPRLYVYIALSGEGQYGPKSGAVVIDTNSSTAKYTLLDEIEPTIVSENIKADLEKDGSKLFFIQKTQTDIHVFLYDRARALEEMSSGALTRLMIENVENAG